MSVYSGSGRICAVVGCSNSQRNIRMWKNGTCDIHLGVTHEECECRVPYSLHRFPKDQNLHRQWIAALNRKDYIPSKNSRVCSVHFLDNAPTKENPCPQRNLGYQKKVIKGRRPLEKSQVENSCPLKKRRLHQSSIDVQDTDGCGEQDETDEVPDSSSKVPQVTYKLMKCVEKKSQSCQTSVTMRDQGTQWENQALVDHNYSKVHQATATTCNRSAQADMPFLSARSISMKDCSFYTGLRLDIFFHILAMIQPDVQGFSFKMDVGDQLLLVLMRLRLGLLHYDLGRRFQCSTSLASKIFNDWIPVLKNKLQALVCWLPREIIRATLPSKFADLYPKTTCIIDCTEVFIQRPTYLRARSQTFSNYKHHNTMKFLVAIAPSGYVMFLSKCYGGRASDLHIVENCGFYDYIRPGDEVMADRGFKIDEELWLRQAKLNMPSSTRGKAQLSELEVTKTRRIASVRVHVERAIARIKQYRILKTVLPLDNLNKSADNMIMVCAALTNLQSPLIKDPELEVLP